MAKRLTPKQNLIKGLFKENPTFVLVLGMCPTLGVTTSLENALGMGISVLFVLMITNALISIIRKYKTTILLVLVQELTVENTMRLF